MLYLDEEQAILTFNNINYDFIFNEFENVFKNLDNENFKIIYLNINNANIENLNLIFNKINNFKNVFIKYKNCM